MDVARGARRVRPLRRRRHRSEAGQRRRQERADHQFGESPKGLLADPPACLLHLQADWVGNAMSAAVPGTKVVDDIDFFPFPTVNPSAAGSLEITGEVLGAFRDTPQIRAFLRYVSTPEFSSLVAATGLWLGANTRTPVEEYPSPLSKQAAQAYAAAKDVRFGAKDAMPAAMSQAFLKSVMDEAREPAKLDAILGGLERTRQSSYRCRRADLLADRDRGDPRGAAGDARLAVAQRTAARPAAAARPVPRTAWRGCCSRWPPHRLSPVATRADGVAQPHRGLARARPAPRRRELRVPPGQRRGPFRPATTRCGWSASPAAAWSSAWRWRCSPTPSGGRRSRSPSW